MNWGVQAYTPHFQARQATFCLHSWTQEAIKILLLLCSKCQRKEQTSQRGAQS